MSAIIRYLYSVFIGIATSFLPPPKVVHAAGDPNIYGSFCYVVPCDGAFETTPTVTDVALAACPVGLGYQMIIEFVGFRANVLPIDSAGTGTILCDVEFIDDSAGDAVANLNSAAVSLEADAMTALVCREVWKGSQVLDPGDVLNAEITCDGTNNTAAEGAAFVVAGKIVQKSSQ